MLLLPFGTLEVTETEARIATDFSAVGASVSLFAGGESEEEVGEGLGWERGREEEEEEGERREVKEGGAIPFPPLDADPPLSDAIDVREVEGRLVREEEGVGVRGFFGLVA